MIELIYEDNACEVKIEIVGGYYLELEENEYVMWE